MSKNTNKNGFVYFSDGPNKYEDVPIRLSPDYPKTNEIYPIFIDLVDVKEEEETESKETEFPGK